MHRLPISLLDIAMTKDDLAKLNEILKSIKGNYEYSGVEAKLTKLLLEARSHELDRTIAFFGDERPKWESEKVLKAFVNNRKAELKALGTTTSDFQ